MSEIGEAFGTAVEGGLFSRAVGRGNSQAPDNQPLDKGHFAESTCLNCGTPLTGPHCHQCGQKAHLHRTLGAFVHDLMHGVLHIEGKTWRTLPKLVFKPGELTRRYVEGERSKFVSPMALFLFSIFLMFAVFQIVGISAPTDISTRDGVQTGLKEMRADAIAEREKLAEALAKTKEGTPEYTSAEAKLEKTQEAINSLDNAGKIVVGSKGLDSDNIGKTGWSWLDKGIEKWRSNPSLMLYKLQANGYKFSWLLIPISIPFVWLLFAWKRRFKAYDHAIFVTYSIAFMSLLFIAVSLLAVAGISEGLWATMLALIPPVHMYKQLRGAYGLSRFSALWRLVTLMVFISIVLVLFLQLIFLIGAF